jgi:hypothetical protein
MGREVGRTVTGVEVSGDSQRELEIEGRRSVSGLGSEGGSGRFGLCNELENQGGKGWYREMIRGDVSLGRPKVSKVPGSASSSLNSSRKR